MATETTTTRTARFGPYEVDLRSGELHKYGTKLKLGEQPLRILIRLMQRRGELITREELRAELWAHHTFVDFDHSLNSAVQRLRDCLADSAEKARWIETVPRRGYRFVGEVEWSENGPAAGAVAEPKDGGGKDSATLPSVAEESPGRQSKGGFNWLRPAAAGVGVVILLLAGVGIYTHYRKTEPARQALVIRSLAVLPLENLSGDPAEEYFVDGMTDELITVLAKNRSLRVISRTSVMKYKKVHRPLPEIARELGVDGIIEGSVVRSGGKVRMTAQLIHGPSDTHMWADSYDRDLGDILSLQKELAETISTQAAARFSASGNPRTIRPEAHDAYLRGRYYWFSDSGFNQSREYFERAIQLQPDYAAPWSGLADYYAALAVEGRAQPRDVSLKALQLASKAVELDDSLPEGHNSLAAINLLLRWDWDTADRESRRATELNPNFAEAHHVRSYVLATLNRTQESVEEERKATDLDPYARPWSLGFALVMAHRVDDALHELRQRSQVHPDDSSLRESLAEVYRLKGIEKESVQELEKSLLYAGDKNSADAVHRAYKQGGLRGVDEWELQQLQKQAAKGYVSPHKYAALYAELGDKEQTLHFLELAYNDRAPRLIRLQLDPRYDFLHSEPRYRALVKKIGLAPAF